MSDITRRPRRRPSRSARVERGYAIAVVGGGAALVAAVCLVLFRRAVS